MKEKDMPLEMPK